MRKLWLFLFFVQLSTLKGQELYFEPNVGQITVPPDYEQSEPLALIKVPLGQIYVLNDRLRLRLINPEDKPKIHQSVHFKDMDTSFTIRYQVMDVIFSEAQPPSHVLFEHPTEFYFNYYLSKNPKDWKTGVTGYKGIRLTDIYPNIDLKIYTQKGHVEFDWILKQGANVDNIQLKCAGIKNTEITPKGWSLFGENASFTLGPAIAFQENKPFNCTYVQKSENEVWVKTPNVSPTKPFRIDPVLVFSTYSGSTADNFGFTATFDNTGCLYAGGIVDASSRSYPVTTGAFQTTYGGSSNPAEPVYLPCDISISKYSPDGSTLLYATYLGGNDNEYPHSLCTDSKDNLLLLGSTESNDFPIHLDSNLQVNWTGGYDIVMTKFNPSGTQMMGGTYLGGRFNDGFQTNNATLRSNLLFNYADNYRGDITTDENGNVYIATCTQTDVINGINGYQSKNNGLTDGLVFSTSPNFSQLRWGTFLGGNEHDAAYSCRLDNQGHLFIGGGTESDNFPIEGNNPYDTVYRQAIDGFISKLDANNGNYLAGTYWGNWGISPEPVAYDQIYFIDLDPDGKVYFTGQTTGDITRTSGIYGQDRSGQMIGRFDNDLTTLELITTFGNTDRGNPSLSPSAFMVDDCYQIYFSGWGSNIGVGNSGTTDGLEVTTDAHQSNTDGNDFYLLALSKDAKSLLYASYFGGDESEDHVDGGTSRFDKRGIVYQSVCASCPNQPPGLNDFPTTTGAAFEDNISIRCSNASFKLDFRLGYSIDAKFRTVQTLCLKQRNEFTPVNRYTADYFWDFGDGDTSTLFSPIHTYKDTGTYRVYLRVVEPNSCNVEALDSFDVTVILSPEAEVEQFIQPCESGVLFQAKGDAFDSIFWDFGDNSEIIINDNPVTHEFDNPNFNCTVIFKNSLTGCVDTQFVTGNDTSGKIQVLQIANTITPNNDGFNDCFRIYGFSPECEKGYLRIYNRWGALVFHTDDLAHCWDGTVENAGPEVPSGTYFYILDLEETQNPNNPKMLNGVIHVIR